MKHCLQKAQKMQAVKPWTLSSVTTSQITIISQTGIVFLKSKHPRKRSKGNKYALAWRPYLFLRSLKQNLAQHITPNISLKGLFFVVFRVFLLLITTLELRNLSKSLANLEFCPEMVDFTSVVYFCHHNIHQSTTLGDVGYPLHLRVHSFLHLTNLCKLKKQLTKQQFTQMIVSKQHTLGDKAQNIGVLQRRIQE